MSILVNVPYTPRYIILVPIHLCIDFKSSVDFLKFANLVQNARIVYFLVLERKR